MKRKTKKKLKSRNPVAIVTRNLRIQRDKSIKEKRDRADKKLAEGYMQTVVEKDCVE